MTFWPLGGSNPPMSRFRFQWRGTRFEDLYRNAERRVVNPAMRWLLLKGIAPRAFALLETIGRRTGRPQLTPVGNGLQDHVFWLVSLDGTKAGYVQNLLANPRVRVRIGRRWRTGSATLIPEDDSYQRRRDLDRANGLLGRINGLVFRTVATDVCTIRIDLTEH